jgi:hypothetical protein
MTVVQILDQGNAFAPHGLNIDEQVLIDNFLTSIKSIAAISLPLSTQPSYRSLTRQLVQELLCDCTGHRVHFRGSWEGETLFLLHFTLTISDPTIGWTKISHAENTERSKDACCYSKSQNEFVSFTTHIFDYFTYLKLTAVSIITCNLHTVA